MTPRRLTNVFLGVVLTSTGTYVFVYLGRWEWNRALLAAVIFLAAEVALAAVLLLERLQRLEGRLEQRPPSTSQVLPRLREAAPPPSEPFAWLRPRSDELGVFVPILMGVGVVASALAWVARATAGPALERGLADRLRVLAWPERPLTEPEPDASELLRGPSGARAR
jgi:hypothetical protein